MSEAPRRLTVERPEEQTHDDVVADTGSKCRLCKKDHPLRKCPTFRGMNPYRRLSVVKRYKYCINCLAHSHFLKNCRSRDRCMECLEEHHTMLHFRKDSGRSNNNNKKTADSSKTNKNTASGSTNNKNTAGSSKNKKKPRKSATHNQAHCTCSCKKGSNNNEESAPPSNATIVINVMARQ